MCRSLHKGLLKNSNKNSGTLFRRSFYPLTRVTFFKQWRDFTARRKCMIYTEIHTNEYSFIIQMSVAAGSRKFPTDKENQENRIKRSERRVKKRAAWILISIGGSLFIRHFFYIIKMNWWTKIVTLLEPKLSEGNLREEWCRKPRLWGKKAWNCFTLKTHTYLSLNQIFYFLHISV